MLERVKNQFIAIAAPYTGVKLGITMQVPLPTNISVFTATLTDLYQTMPPANPLTKE